MLESLVEVAKIQSTSASNKIENIATSDKRLRDLMAEKAEPKNRDEREIAGYRFVLDTIHERHDAVPVTPGVILQLHRDLYQIHWRLVRRKVEGFRQRDRREVGQAGRWSQGSGPRVPPRLRRR